MVSRTAVFLKVHSESIMFNRKAFDEKVNNPDFIFGIDGLIKRNRERMDLISAMSPDEFHIFKIQNPGIFKISTIP